MKYFFEKDKYYGYLVIFFCVYVCFRAIVEFLYTTCCFLIFSKNNSDSSIMHKFEKNHCYLIIENCTSIPAVKLNALLLLNIFLNTFIQCISRIFTLQVALKDHFPSRRLKSLNILEKWKLQIANSNFFIYRRISKLFMKAFQKEINILSFFILLNFEFWSPACCCLTSNK